MKYRYFIAYTSGSVVGNFGISVDRKLLDFEDISSAQRYIERKMNLDKVLITNIILLEDIHEENTDADDRYRYFFVYSFSGGVGNCEIVTGVRIADLEHIKKLQELIVSNNLVTKAVITHFILLEKFKEAS